MERKLFTHMAGNANDINNNLTHAGWRSQTIAYRPACDTCNACRSVRVDVAGFKASRNMKRILATNNDLTQTPLPPQTSREQYELLRRYSDTRHRDGGMSDMSSFDYMAMVEETAVQTEISEYRDARGTLVACLLRDRMQDGISLVYSFRSGSDNTQSRHIHYSRQIRQAEAEQLPHIYLGYLIENCSKMSYKKRFTPLQILDLRAGTTISNTKVWEDFMASKIEHRKVLGGLLTGTAAAGIAAPAYGKRRLKMVTTWPKTSPASARRRKTSPSACAR